MKSFLSVSTFILFWVSLIAAVSSCAPVQPDFTEPPATARIVDPIHGPNFGPLPAKSPRSESRKSKSRKDSLRPWNSSSPTFDL